MEPQNDDELIDQLIGVFNADPKFAKEATLEVLKTVLRTSELRYSNSASEPAIILEDKVYDYLRELVAAQEADSGAKDDMEHVPEPKGRMCDLPIWMGSITKMNEGTGQVTSWKQKFDGPYVVSAKLDGASVLYWNDLLLSRGKGSTGQDITELLQYLNLPKLPPGVAVRGELIMKKSIFNARYKRQSDEDNDPSKYRNSRNAISGLINKIGSSAVKGGGTSFSASKLKFVSDVEFICYEYIEIDNFSESRTFMQPDAQFARLLSIFGNEKVARHEIINDFDDDSLSMLYDSYTQDDYEIDGLVVCSDQTYDRPYGKNPEFMRAFKKPLEVLTSITTVTGVEWNVSKDGMLKPVVLFDPITLDDVTITRATGYNARFILEKLIGPGAEIEVTRAGGVIPKIIDVLTPAGMASLPENQGYYWNDSKVEIYAEHADGESFRTMRVKQLHHFLTKLDTKGIGESLVGRMFDGGIQNIPQLLTVTEEQLAFIGGKTAANIVKTIQERKQKLTMPVLCGASMIFGRLMGVRRFEMIFERYPDFLQMACVVDHDSEAIIKLLVDGVDGFARKTAVQVADGLDELLDLLEKLEQIGIQVPVSRPKSRNTSPQNSGTKKRSVQGLHVLLTGFRDSKITEFIGENGGKIISSLTKTASLVIVKDVGTRNNKTIEAEQRGVEIITKDEFIRQYM